VRDATPGLGFTSGGTIRLTTPGGVLEVDEFCIKDRLSFYIECKNKFSDCLTAPKKGTKLHELGEEGVVPLSVES